MAFVPMSSFMARRPASWQIDTISAPEQPCVCAGKAGSVNGYECNARSVVLTRSASISRSTSSAMAILRVRMAKICRRATKSGGPTYRRRSNRPGRNRAESRTSGRLVAAITSTLDNCSTPSISLSNVVINRSLAPPSAPLDVVRPSISSKKTMEGDAARALRNTSRRARSDSPTYLFNS